MAKEKRNSSHIKAQLEGRNRDLNSCQGYGSKNNVAGHHVIDFQYGVAAHADNIITLCREHHQKVHSNKISIILS